MIEIAKYVDHTILKPDATNEDVKKVCREAIENGFYSVCVNSIYTKLCKEELKNSNVKVAVVVGFPLGQTYSAIKGAEAKLAVLDGADEIDMVMNISALKNKNYHLVGNDISAVVECGVPVKVILESPLLSDLEIEKAVEIAVEKGACFVKTCTGFLGGIATIHDIETMKKASKGRIKIKASGGIRDDETARKMIEAGADRIGASKLCK